MSLKNSIVFLFFSLLLLPSAQARKPAVEDFVGVEPETYSATGEGTEVLFNFGNTVQAYTPTPVSVWDQWIPLGVLGGFLLLPFVMWFAITRSTATSTSSSSQETLGKPVLGGNVTNLKDYQTQSDKDEEDFEQAS